MSLAVFTSVIFIAVCFLFITKALPKENIKDTKFVLIAVFVAVFAIKIAFAYFTVGYSTDIVLFKAWGDLCNKIGFSNVYYQDNVYLDYPPAYLYVLSMVDKIKTLLQLDYYEPMYTLLIKLPALICDMLSGILIYKISNKKFGKTLATGLAVLYMLNPLVVMDGNIWGQMDSVAALFLALSLYQLNKKRFISSGCIYAITLLLKPQMLIFVPIYFFYTLVHKKYKGLLLGIFGMGATVVLLALPFSQQFNFEFLIKCYSSTLGYYHHYTINAYNLFAMLGKNWAQLPLNNVASFLLTWTGPVIATLLTAFYMFKNKTKSAIFNAGALIMATVFMFTANMHERYLFPAILLILIAYIFNKDKRYLYVFTAFSVVSFLNVAYILYLNNTYISSTSPQIIILSFLNLLTYFYYVYLLFFGGKIKMKKIILPKLNLKPTICEKIDKKLYKKDYIIILIITVFYGFFAFYNLGSTKTANTSWRPNTQESVTLNVNGEYDSILYLVGISKTNESTPKVGSNFIIETSNDGENFTFLQDISSTSVYTWSQILTANSSDYIRITANDSISVLNEIAFKNSATEQFLPVSIVSGNGTALIDEQGNVPLYPSYLNSMYFDEIYHARTAYEHILDVEPYENTHPPLGKLIMSLCITIFGMNPFGWRFAGALLGVLMLPVFYHVLKRLFGNSMICACGTLLFAFDFMHYTQTRIATIDTFAVFFILLMYDAMLVFIQKDFEKSSTISLIIPLACSGLFMGLGVASKWTCAYGAVGLAVLFFAKLVYSYINAQNKKMVFARIIDLCLYCLLVFVAIPFAIYFTAFLPMTTLPQNANNVWGSFINYQVHMFNYHSGLVAEHYFASPWYEWPLAIRNIWYYFTNNFNGQGLLSSISCVGNPLLWWSSLLALVFVVYSAVKTKSANLFFIIIGFMAVYIPWTLVPRLTFVYHYFTAVPFIIMALMYVFKVSQRNAGMENVKKIKPIAVCIGFVVVNFVLFIMFLPAIGGVPTTQEYVDFLEWMPNWYFG